MKYLPLLILLLCPFHSEAGVVSRHGRLSVQGNQLVDSQEQPVVLRGISFGWHNWWPRFYNAGAVAELANEWHCSVVRAAMGVTPAGAYLDRPEWSATQISAVVEAAIKADIYVIIDWHSHELRKEEAKAFFADMARKYGRYPHVIYEIFNEPIKQPWSEVREYSAEIIKGIRETDPDNIILVGTPHWDQDVHLAAADPVAGFNNLMYTIHFYAGGHGEKLRSHYDAALQKGLPLFASECASMSPDGNGPLNREEWERWLKWLEKNRISWVVWSVADKDETCSMLRPSASSTGPWTDKDLKESGILTKSCLKKAYENNNTRRSEPAGCCANGIESGQSVVE